MDRQVLKSVLLHVFESMRRMKRKLISLSVVVEVEMVEGLVWMITVVDRVQVLMIVPMIDKN